MTETIFYLAKCALLFFTYSSSKCQSFLTFQKCLATLESCPHFQTCTTPLGIFSYFAFMTLTSVPLLFNSSNLLRRSLLDLYCIFLLFLSFITRVQNIWNAHSCFNYRPILPLFKTSFQRLFNRAFNQDIG